MAEINLWDLIVVKLSELGILKRYFTSSFSDKRWSPVTSAIQYYYILIKIHIYISFISQRVKPHFHSIFNTVLIGIFYISKLKSVLPLTMTQPNCQIPLAIFMKTFDRRNNKNQGWDCGKWRPAHELFSPSPAPRAQFSSLRTGERSGAFQSVHHR